MSRSFLSLLTGIAMTVFSWYGPWEWPAWPAFTAVRLLFGRGGYDDLPFAQKATVLVGLIVLNVTFWAAVVAVIAAGFARYRAAYPARTA
jgi:hypothetical protein